MVCSTARRAARRPPARDRPTTRLRAACWRVAGRGRRRATSPPTEPRPRHGRWSAGAVDLPTPGSRRALWATAMPRSELRRGRRDHRWTSPTTTGCRPQRSPRSPGELAAPRTTRDAAGAAARPRAGTGRPGPAGRAHRAPRAWDDLVLPDGQLRAAAPDRGHVAAPRPRLRRLGLRRRAATRARASRALFAGESGTGKTMAAEVLAGELGLDLYRIDLAARRQQVHRRDREEPAPRLRRRRGRRRHPALRRGRRAVRQAQRGQGQPRPLRQHRGQLPAAADGGLPRPGDPDHQPAANARPRVPAPAALRRAVPVPGRGRSAPRSGAGSSRQRRPLADLEPEALARLQLSGGSIRSIALAAAFSAAEAGTPIEPRHLLRAAQVGVRQGRAHAHRRRDRCGAGRWRPVTRLEIEIGEIVLRDLPAAYAGYADGLGPLVEQRLAASAEGTRHRTGSSAPGGDRPGHARGPGGPAGLERRQAAHRTSGCPVSRTPVTDRPPPARRPRPVSRPARSRRDPGRPRRRRRRPRRQRLRVVLRLGVARGDGPPRREGRPARRTRRS